MAYSTSNPPKLVVQDIGNQGPATWTLTGTDAASVVQVTGYITNGGDLGMKVGDLVEYFETDAKVASGLYVSAVSSTAPGAVDLGNATTIASGTNSD